jgi:diadenosine tetraphosphatase ApaH/serine/threonine PP2A family protein phosphatase
MSKRTIVIGDIHGCFEELQDLLRAVKAGPEDRLISVGDLICKGPDSRGVLEWALSAPNLECVLGNHELRFLHYWKRNSRSAEKSYDAETYAQIGDFYEEAMEYVSELPLTVSGPGFTVVHAGFDPREGIEWQSASQLTSLRRLKDTGKAWYLSYKDPRLVVFGHWAAPDPVVRRNAVGLDTGCVYGGALSALILPERRLVSVPARRIYRKKESWPAKQLLPL